MRKKVLFCSFVAAVLLVVASFVSVVGYQSVQTNEKTLVSPLFTTRTQQATQQARETGVSAFLGKGNPVNIFSQSTAHYEEMIQTAIRILRTNPALVATLLDNLERYPALYELVTDYGVRIGDVKNYLRLVVQNPSVLDEGIIDTYLPEFQEHVPQPLGLSTSSALGCFIVALVALLPITLVLTLLALVFTLRIFTCLNVNDCANAIAKGIWDQLIQGLTQG